MNNTIYKIAQSTHVLIAGTTGSGKSVLLNNIICELLYYPDNINLVLIDTKRVELNIYKRLPCTIDYITENTSVPHLLDKYIDIMESRYKYMESNGLKEYDGTHIYIIFDEIADLMITIKNDITPRLQRLLQLARSARIHIIACTQAPSRKIIPAELTLNFTDRIALRCISATESRQIIITPGAELLPKYGTALYRHADGIEKISIPLLTESDTQKAIKYCLQSYK